jgi:acetoin utilization deacetylase AcuC-like enzyme
MSPFPFLFLGEAILAAQMAYDGEPAFGLIRPPGHNASPDSCWGFCYFNNMAVSLRGLMKEGKIKKALILDFGLHFGDGTENAFMGNSNVDYFHPEGSSKKDFIQEIESHLEGSKEFDYPAVLTSFDRHVEYRGR